MKRSSSSSSPSRAHRLKARRAAAPPQGHVKPLTKQNHFLTFVFLGALAEDMRCDTANAQLIAHMAMQIPESKIPDCPANAARAFLAYCTGRTARPFKWML